MYIYIYIGIYRGCPVVAKRENALASIRKNRKSFTGCASAAELHWTPWKSIDVNES